jgi:hypothetical protein
MLLRRRQCTGGPTNPDPEIPLPLEIGLPGGGTAILAEREKPGDYVLTIVRTVSRSGLELVAKSGSYRENEDGELVGLPQVRVNPDAVEGEYDAQDVFDALSLPDERGTRPSPRSLRGGWPSNCRPPGYATIHFMRSCPRLRQARRSLTRRRGRQPAFGREASAFGGYARRAFSRCARSPRAWQRSPHLTVRRQ